MLNVSSKICHFLASGVILARFSHDRPDLNADFEIAIAIFNNNIYYLLLSDSQTQIHHDQMSVPTDVYLIPPKVHIGSPATPSANSIFFMKRFARYQYHKSPHADTHTGELGWQ